LNQGTNAFDGAVRGWVLAHQNPAVHSFFAWSSRIGSVSPFCWAGVAVCLLLLFRKRTRAAVSGLLAPLLAVLTYLGAKRFLPRVRPPSEAALREATHSFPSAHATTSTAVCCTIAYLLWREQILSSRVALLVALVPPLIIGVSRVYLDVHWTTDVVGGWIAGLLITGIARVSYDRSPFFS
jgi:membrane-associated phospholipid phosphatase